MLSCLLAFALAGCAGAVRPPACPLPGQTAGQTLRLYFGRSLPGGGMVSDAAWARFAADVLTPAFPDGFSVSAASGQWRDDHGAITREPSLVVEHDGALDAARTQTVIDAYKSKFHQQAVGVVTSPVCLAF